MINITLYTADCTGNSGNCLYPNKAVVTNKDEFIAAIKTDHVTAKYKGNYRSKDNFEYSDCIPLDCDNDHSENLMTGLHRLTLQWLCREFSLQHLIADTT